jgi:hypothetical protein
MEWNTDLIESINQRRSVERDRAPEMAEREDNLFRLMSRSLYGEKVHYALELIQNAEDADSSSITFIFERDRVIVVNDGEIFTADDVDAICSVKPGRKKNKIGFFGVGFKSVFNITNVPQVISADFNFEIYNYIYPKPCVQVPEGAEPFYSRERGSIFVLPESEELHSIPELVENFKEIDDKILLFLDDLKALHFIDNVEDERWSIEKPPTSDTFIHLKDGRTGQTTKWRVFHEDLPVSQEEVPIPEGKEGIENTRVLVAFPCDDLTKEANKGSTVYCYLPTNKRSDMPFLVQADFVPTVGRDSIQDVEWNKWLLRKLGRLAAEAIDQLINDEELGADIYCFIPLKGEVHEPLMDILSGSMYEALRSKKIGKTLGHEWKLPEECVIPVSPEIPKIVQEKELKCVFGKPLFYFDVRLSERADTILHELGAQLFSEGHFIDFLSKEELIRDKSRPWFLRTYAYLGEIFDVSQKRYDGSFKWDENKIALFHKLERANFILTNRKILVPLKDPERADRLICYPQKMNLSEINALFNDGELVFLNTYFQLSTIFKRKDPGEDEESRRKKARQFFEGVGVKKYFRQSHVINQVILPKYSSGKYQEYDDRKLFNFINYIRQHWSILETDVRNKKITEKIFEGIKQTVLLKAFTIENGVKVEAYLPPSRIYFSDRYSKTTRMEELFEGLERLYFLHPYYLNREKRERKKKRRGRQKVEYGWKKFGEMLGVWSSPRVVKNHEWKSISGGDGYKWIDKKCSTSREHDISGDSVSEDIERLIKHCSGVTDKAVVRKKMEILWQALSDNWKDYKKHCSVTYRYYYRKYKDETRDSSSFLNYLRKANWVPATDGSFCEPGKAYIDTPKNKLLIGDKITFVSLNGSQAFMQDIGLNLEPKIHEVLAHMKEYKEAHPRIEKRELRKFKEIIEFLAEPADLLGLTEIREEFEGGALLYIPREDRCWWKPSMVFWKDLSGTFGTLRGYVEHEEEQMYPSEVKDFLHSVGVEEAPSVEQALGVLEELRQKNDIKSIESSITKIYSYINDLLNRDYGDQVRWEEYLFLTTNMRFCSPSETYFEDDVEYARPFEGKANFISLPFSSWINVHHFLTAADFKSFAGNLVVEKHLGEVGEVEGDEALSVIKALSLVKPFLLKKNLEAYERLKVSGVFALVEQLEVYNTSLIKLDLCLKKNESETIDVNGLEKEAYYSNDENRLYLRQHTSFSSPEVAKELSRIFPGNEDEVFLFLSSVLPKADDEEALEKQLGYFGIEEEQDYVGLGEVQIIEDDEGQAEEGEQHPEDKDEENPEKEEEGENGVKPPEDEKKQKGVIDPDEYYPASKKEYTAYKRTEGQEPIVTKEIKLAKGKRGEKKPPKDKMQRRSRIDAEGTAITIVMNYENGENWETEDRHKQRRIGYDVYCSNDQGDEKFIEVKHFGEQEGRFKLTPHELKKAKEEQDRYYVYVVTGLAEGDHSKKVFIIQNPTKWLTPNPPVEKEYSDWKNAVKKEVTMEKA